MLTIIKRTTLGAGILLVMPLLVWISGWQWEPKIDSFWLKGMFWMTETVTKPWGIMTHIILCAWFLWCLRYRLRAAIVLFFILATAIMVGQWLKSAIKDRVQEPRPFVVWLEKTHHVPVTEFYNLKRKDRGMLVKSQLQDEIMLPVWLRKHWQKETGFAFPSGHTMFAASWALLGVGLLWPRRRKVTLAFLLIWASGVMASRMVLGMHWPQDIVVATLISWLLVTMAVWLAERLCGPFVPPVEEVKEIQERHHE